MKNWNTVDISSKNVIESYTKGKFKICNYSFINLIIWGASGNIKYSEEEEILYLKEVFSEDDKNKLGEKEKDFYVMPVAKDFSLEKIKQGINNLVDEGHEIHLIPEDIKTALEGEFIFEEMVDTADYIYQVEDLAYLKGRKYSKKKNKINQFMKNDFVFENISSENIGEIKKYQDKWCLSKECQSNPSLKSEYFGLVNIFDNFAELDLIGGMLKINGEIVAYTLGEKLTDEILLLHTEKADEDCNGSYQAINSIFLEKNGLSFKFVNREDDAGIEGLRKAKESYFPFDKFKKFKIKGRL
ncbi:MAG: DUF2156 domain-containing protein [Fusobacteriaceae bacterium]